MTHKPLALLVLLALGSPMTIHAAESDDSTAANAFRQLSTLVGEWEGTFADGRKHQVTYRLSAGGTVLVETWALAPGRESLTLYHRDGESLIADHYCPQGNQPRLQLTRGAGDDRLSFTFRDGTNLRVKGKAHQHAFWIRVLGQDSFERSETYDAGVDHGNSLAAMGDVNGDGLRQPPHASRPPLRR